MRSATEAALVHLAAELLDDLPQVAKVFLDHLYGHLGAGGILPLVRLVWVAVHGSNSVAGILRFPLNFAPFVRRPLRLFSADVENVQRVLELVRYFHPPVPAGRKLPVYALKDLSGCYRGFLPRRMLVGKIFAFLINLMALMRDMKEVPRHAPVML
ncbi:hypothetical protein [uncultured Bradyrhizobium sp.]|uniref:hypothetical protein n=1 Tax=uncultured Bradyrhizobium sp. TaxID=199684 RepID=UPI002609DDD0|nr:hypothetical protein [uncultured Bradyrhizobium sp.]